MARLLLAPLWLPALQALRLVEESGWVQYPNGTVLEARGRHIQMLYGDPGHGLTDRIKKYLYPLLMLGHYYDARVHIHGGTRGVKQWLTHDHTVELADDWGRYFDLEAHGGNPFHEVQNFRGCRELRYDGLLSKLLELFEHGEHCVNIVTGLPVASYMPHVMRNVDLEVSQEIRQTADAFLKRYHVGDTYGSVHIRRCDFFLKTKTCTAPATIAQSISQYGAGLKTWLFFLYAEEGYQEALAEALKPLGVRALFEDDIVLNDKYPQDNYFTYLLGKYLNGGAETILETHMCKQPPPLVLRGGDRGDVRGHGIYLQRDVADAFSQAQQAGEMFLELEEEAAAVCDSRARGAHLLHPGGFKGPDESQVVRRHER